MLPLSSTVSYEGDGCISVTSPFIVREKLYLGAEAISFTEFEAQAVVERPTPRVRLK